MYGTPKKCNTKSLYLISCHGRMVVVFFGILVNNTFTFDCGSRTNALLVNYTSYIIPRQADYDSGWHVVMVVGCRSLPRFGIPKQITHLNPVFGLHVELYDMGGTAASKPVAAQSVAAAQSAHLMDKDAAQAKWRQVFQVLTDTVTRVSASQATLSEFLRSTASDWATMTKEAPVWVNLEAYLHRVNKEHDVLERSQYLKALYNIRSALSAQDRQHIRQALLGPSDIVSAKVCQPLTLLLLRNAVKWPFQHMLYMVLSFFTEEAFSATNETAYLRMTRFNPNPPRKAKHAKHAQPAHQQQQQQQQQAVQGGHKVLTASGPAVVGPRGWGPGHTGAKTNPRSRGTLTLRAYVADSVLGLQGFDFREGRAVPIVMDSTDTVGYTNGSTTNLTILAFQLKTKILANPSTPHTLNNGTILRAASSGDVSLGPIVTELYNGFSATHASSLRLVSAADDESQGEIVEYVDPTVGYRITSANLANISSKKYKLQYPVTVNGTQYWEDVFLDTISSDGADVYGAASSNVAHFLILKYQYTITAAEQSTVTSYTQVTNGVRYRLAKITVDMPTDAEEAVIAAGDLDAQIDFKNISYLVRTDDNVSFNLGEQITHDRLPYSEGTSLEYMMYLLPQSGSTPIDLGTYQLNVFDPQSGTFEPLTKTSDSSVMEWLFYRGVQVSLSNIAPRSYNISSQLNMPWSLSTTSLYAVYNYDATEYIDDAQTITGWKLADLEITAGPNAMIDLVEPDTQPNLLRMTSAPNSSGKYTMYIDEEFAPQAHREVSTATLVITDTNGVPVTFNFKYMFLRPPKVLSIVDTWEPSSRVNDNGELIDTLSAADLVPLNGFTNERKVMELYLESYDATDAGLTLRPLGTVGWASPSGSFEAYSYARLNLDTTSEYIVDGVPTRRLEVYVTMVDGFLPSQPTIVQLTTQMLNNSFTWVDGKYLSGSGQIPFDTFSIFAAAPEAGQVVVGTSATVVSGTIDYATRTGTATLSEIPNDMEVGDALLLGPTNNGNFGTITAIDSVNKIVSFEGLRRSILTPSDIAELEALQVKTMFFPSTVLEGTALKGPTGITITDQEQDESLVKTGTPHLYVYSSDDLLVDADGDVEEEPDAYLIATIEFPVVAGGPDPWRRGPETPPPG